MLDLRRSAREFFLRFGFDISEGVLVGLQAGMES